jgi:hypothetical protein
MAQYEYKYLFTRQAFYVCAMACLWMVLIAASHSNVLAQEAGLQTTSKKPLNSELQKDLAIIDNYYSKVKEKVSNGEVPETLQAPGNSEEIPGTPAEEITYAPVAQRSLPLTASPSQGRDPFALTDKIYAASNGVHGRYNFVPGQISASGGELPKMKLRGLIRNQNNELAALLEIVGDGIYVVRPDDAIGVYSSGNNSVIKIRSIDALSVVVEMGSLGQVVIVR